MNRNATAGPGAGLPTKMKTAPAMEESSEKRKQRRQAAVAELAGDSEHQIAQLLHRCRC